MLQYKYNPQQASPGELKATFTAREKILEDLLYEIRQHAKSKANQHYLIIGPRGIGKTNFLRMIYLNSQQDEQLAKNWIPLQFAEEEYAIGSLRDFFIKIVEVLNVENVSTDTDDFLESLRTEERDDVAAEKAIGYLENFSKNAKKKFLLLVDNLDLILGDQLRDDIDIKRLRDILMNGNFILLIGAAPTYFEEVANYDKPMYNFFKLINLDDLDAAQIEELIIRRAKYDGNTPLLERLPAFRPKLRALRHLTGGNPRLILMLYQFLTLSEFGEVKDYLIGLLDDLTPYYQYKLKWLSPQQRRIIDGMARLNRAVSPTEIAKECRLAVNVVSSNLKRLMDWGYIKLGQQERRKTTYYIITERMFRIWHQMRHSPGMRRKIQFFVEFIKIWYTLIEMKAEAKRLQNEFGTYLFEQKLYEAKGVIEHLDYLAAAASDAEFQSNISDRVIRMMVEVEDFSGAEKKLSEKLTTCEKLGNKQKIADCYYEFAYVHFEKNDISNELNYLNKSLEIWPYSHKAWYTRGLVLGRLDQFEEAIQNFDKALEIKPDMYEAWHSRGLALGRLGKYKEALPNYDKAVEIKPDMYEAWYNRGNILSRLGQHGEAIFSYDKALEIKSDLYETWRDRGVALRFLGQYSKAIDSILKALTFARTHSEIQQLYYWLYHAYLILSLNNISQNNFGNLKSAFASALTYLSGMRETQSSQSNVQALANYFTEILSKNRIKLVNELFSMIKEKGLNDELVFLEPFRIAIRYWETGRDAEVLDRLNPEVREIVEEIIKNAEQKDNEKAKPHPNNT